MTTSSIIIIAAVFLGSFLLMIPFMIYSNKKKKNQEKFVSNNTGKAVIHIYGDSISINNIPMQHVEHTRGADLQHIVSLAPGQHVISAKYTATSPNMRFCSFSQYS